MTLANPAGFFNAMRAGLLGPTLSRDEVEGCQAIIDAFDGMPLSHAAYALATAYHETAGTMQPIKEYGGPKYFTQRYGIEGANPSLAKRLGNTVPGDGAKFAGRGYVQLTGRANYGKAQQLLGVPFLTSPDLAMQPKHAADIMRRGMIEGWFTGKRLSDYLNLQCEDPVGARRIINGTDRAKDIAGYYRQFAGALSAGGWS